MINIKSICGGLRRSAEVCGSTIVKSLKSLAEVVCGGCGSHTRKSLISLAEVAEVEQPPLKGGRAPLVAPPPALGGGRNDGLENGQTIDWLDRPVEGVDLRYSSSMAHTGSILIDVDQVIAEGWVMYDEIAAKWVDLVRQGGRSDDLPPQRPKTEIVGNVIYPSVFKYPD